MKLTTFMLFMVLLLIAGVLLFFDQVLSIFKGMTVLASMQMIVQFLLHVAVATIVAYAVFQLNEQLLPWIRALKSWWNKFQHRQIKRRNRWFEKQLPTVHTKSGLPRGNKDQVLYWLIAQMAQKNPPNNNSSTHMLPPDDQHRTRLDV